MRCVDRTLAAIAALALAVGLSACGGGNSTQTTLTGGTTATEAAVNVSASSNTTQIVVDEGPSGFSLGGAPNVPYVTVTVCTPNSTTACVTIDHVVLDTGSIGLRVLKSKVAGLALPPVSASGGVLAECYGFVLGQLWGPLASADVRIGGELAPALPIQLIDDGTPAGYAVPLNCFDPSDPKQADKQPMNSSAALQANGILGVGMLPFDCGLDCLSASTKSLYYACPSASTCASAGVPQAAQTQNPVVHFVATEGSTDNNGTMIVLPALPNLGAGVAKGYLVFGIGTKRNNQMPLGSKMYFVGVDPASTGTYLSLSTTLGATTYGDSYIDSGSNAFFFDDASIAQGCQSSVGASSGGWYCPRTEISRVATISDYPGGSNAATTGDVSFAIGNADALFSSPSMALSNLGGTVNQGPNTFVWGLPFFYGRTVFTSIWGQPLSLSGPWNAF